MKFGQLGQAKIEKGQHLFPVKNMMHYRDSGGGSASEKNFGPACAQSRFAGRKQGVSSNRFGLHPPSPASTPVWRQGGAGDEGG